VNQAIVRRRAFPPRAVPKASAAYRPMQVEPQLPRSRLAVAGTATVVPHFAGGACFRRRKHGTRSPRFAAWAALALLVLAGAASAQQDTWTGVDRIVAVGDVHGDYNQFVKTLQAAEVVDEKCNWVAGKTHLVQIGDVLDRGPDSRKAMDLLMKLEVQAAEAGGAVHALIGNHEAMVPMDDLRYVHPGELKAFGGLEGLRKAMGPQGKYGRWIRTHNTVIKINDLLFVHAGITPSTARLTMAQINKAVRDEIDKRDEEGLAGSISGPLWTRALALGDEDEVARALETVLKRYDAKRMVIGHTVSDEGVVARAGGRLIRIDVGMAECYGGPAACLVVEKGVLYEVVHPKTKRKVRSEAPAEKPVPVPAGVSSAPRVRAAWGGASGEWQPRAVHRRSPL
jgi:hypothetical protein